MIKEFNSLKGILALMIFAHHCPLEFDWKLGFGIIAVTLFFMLSGFLSAVGYKERIQAQSFSYRPYIFGKCTKFFPVHLLFLIAAVPLSIMSVTNWLAYLATFVINAALLQSLVPIKSVYFSFNSVSWFLSDTLIFVAIFPFLMRWILQVKQRTKLAICTIIVVIYIAVWIVIPDNYTHQLFYINPLFRFVDFVIGVQCGLWFLELKKHGTLNSIVAKHSTSLHWFGFILLVSLTFSATIDDQICFHSIIYMPLACIALILIGLNGGGICQALFCKKSVLSVTHSFWHIKLS